jgi:hypothetical protein
MYPINGGNATPQMFAMPLIKAIETAAAVRRDIRRDRPEHRRSRPAERDRDDDQGHERAWFPGK